MRDCQAFFTQGEVADRGKVVKIDIRYPQILTFTPGLAEFFILHFQFNLVHLKLMGERSSVICPPLGDMLCSSSERVFSACRRSFLSLSDGCLFPDMVDSQV